VTPVLEKPYISVSINPENIIFWHFINGGHTRKSIMAAPMFLRIKRSIAPTRVDLWTRFLIGFQVCRLANQIIRCLIDSELVVCGINNNGCTWSGQVSVRTKSSTEVSIGSRWSDDSLYELLLFKGKNDHFRSFWIITWKQKKIEKIFQLMKWSAGLAL
jgi:hypothetical protein